MTTKIISIVSSSLVALLALGAFVLSYDALRHVALDYGVGASLVYVWPLLIDFALIVFSMAVLRANLRGEPAWWPWVLVVVFTLTTIGFNLIHANDVILNRDVTRYLVAIVAPVALFLSFETLMTMVKGEITYRNAASRLDAVRHNIDASTAQLDALCRDIEAGQRQLDAIFSDTTAGQNQLADIHRDIDAGQNQLDALRHDIELKRRQLEALKSKVDATSAAPPSEPVASSDDTNRRASDTRRQQVLELYQQGLSSHDIAAQLQVSPRTVQRDLSALNGAVNQ